jgi:hypothetical protein
MALGLLKAFIIFVLMELILLVALKKTDLTGNLKGDFYG